MTQETLLIKSAQAISKANARKHQIKVSGLSWAVDEDYLRELFEDCGNITDISLPRDSVSKHCRGFAFVSFDSSAGIARAFELDGTEVEDMVLRIERPAPRDEKPERFGVVFSRTKEHAAKEGRARRERREASTKTTGYRPF